MAVCAWLGERPSACTGRRGRGRIVAAAMDQPWQRQQGRDAGEAAAQTLHRLFERRACEAHRERVAPAGLAAADVAGEGPSVPQAAHSLRHPGHHRSHAQTPLTRRDLAVLVAQSLPGPEQHAFHGGARDAHAGGDLVVGEPLQLAHHEYLGLGRWEAAERLAQVLEVLLLVTAAACSSPAGRAGSPHSREDVGVDRHLLGTVGAAHVVHAGVVRDPVEPGLEAGGPVKAADPASADRNTSCTMSSTRASLPSKRPA